MMTLKLDDLRSLYEPPTMCRKSGKVETQFLNSNARLSKLGGMLDTRLARCGLGADIISAHFEKARHFIMSDEQDEDFEALNNRLLQELSAVASTLTYTKHIRYIDCINNLKWIIRYRTFLLTRASYEIRRSIVKALQLKNL